MSELEALRVAARARGYPIKRIWVDHDSTQTFEAYDSRRCSGLWSDFSKRFYPILLRWENDDGTRQLMKVEPVIGGTERHPREDWIATGNRFLHGLTSQTNPNG